MGGSFQRERQTVDEVTGERASGEEGKDDSSREKMVIITGFLSFFREGWSLSGHMCTYWNMIWQGFESLCFLVSSFFLSSNYVRHFLTCMLVFMYPTTYLSLDC